MDGWVGAVACMGWKGVWWGCGRWGSFGHVVWVDNLNAILLLWHDLYFFILCIYDKWKELWNFRNMTVAQRRANLTPLLKWMPDCKYWENANLGIRLLDIYILPSNFLNFWSPRWTYRCLNRAEYLYFLLECCWYASVVSSSVSPISSLSALKFESYS